MESDFFTYLSSIHTVDVWNNYLPQGHTLPVVRFERVSYIPDAYHGSAGNCPMYRYQVDHYAKTIEAAQDLADLTHALHARRGVIGTKSCVSFLDNEFQTYYDDTEVYCVTADYMIHPQN